MKKIFCSLMIVTALLVSSMKVSAQAWDKSTKVFSGGIGASQFFHLDNYYYSGSLLARSYYSPITFQINLQGEFGVHKYVGVGFITGIGFRGASVYGYTGEVNIPIGVFGNFHFYQLIADKVKKNLHADKLDVYFGLSIGSGVAFASYINTTRVVPLVFGGVHLGGRYYFTNHFGVNLELGYGKNIVNAGVVYKL